MLDLLLGLLLLAYLVTGLRSGLIRTVGGLIGVVGGLVAALLVTPQVQGLLPDEVGRVLITVLLVVVLVALGQGVGMAIGAAVASPVRRAGPLRALDAIGGGAVGVAVAALILSTLASTLVGLGVPGVVQPVAGSVVLRTIDRFTPPAVQSVVARIRTTFIDEGMPEIVGALGGSTGSGAAPDVAVDTAALRAAGGSVVRITGTAAACGRSQTGSGFLIAPDRVMTNAHVVAGVDEPVVVTRGGDALTARVVFFDPAGDVAVLATDGIDLPVLPLAASTDPGALGAVAGFPHGGPYTILPAEVLQVGAAEVPDITGATSAPRDIAVLAADVEPGNSGGPFLTEDGAVGGLVFAKNPEADAVGYAASVPQIADVVRAAGTYDAAVPSGSCTD